MRFRRVQSALFAAACALGAAAAGCATTKGGEGDKNYTVECTDTAPTGSHIARTKCYRRIDMDERTRRDRAQMEKIQYDTARKKMMDGDQYNKSRPGMATPLVMPSVRTARSAGQSTHAR
jgi:hypothetical protein